MEGLAIVFFLLFMLSIVALILGLIKPSIVTRGARQTRKFSSLFYGLASIICLVVFVVSVPNTTTSSTTDSASSNDVVSATSSNVNVSTSSNGTTKSVASSAPAKTTTESSEKKSVAPAPKTWKTVATFKGDSIGNTKLFTVGSQWRIVWKSSPGAAGAANFAGTVNSSDGSSLDMLGNVIGNGSDTTYEHSAGTFYINFMADENYTVSVQTNVSTLPKQPSYTWKTVAHIAGSSTKNTQDFNLKAPWRVVWSASPGSIGSANFSATINAGGSSSDAVGQFADVIGKASGTDYEYQSGSFNFSILADENYSLDIQEAN